MLLMLLLCLILLLLVVVVGWFWGFYCLVRMLMFWHFSWFFFVLHVWGTEDKDDASTPAIVQTPHAGKFSHCTVHTDWAPFPVAYGKGDKYILFWENSVIYGEIQKNHCHRCRVMPQNWSGQSLLNRCDLICQYCWGGVHSSVRCKKSPGEINYPKTTTLLKAKAKT